MPKNAIEIDTTVEFLPDVMETFAVPVIIGEDEGGDAVEGDLIRVTSVSKAEDEFGSETNITDNIEGALDEGVPFVYGYKTPLDTGDVYPVDILWDDVEDDLRGRGIDVIGAADFDAGDDNDEVSDLADLASDINAISVLPLETDDVETDKTVLDVEDSKNLFAVAHDYDEEVVGNFVGAVAKVEANDKLMWKRIRAVDVEQFYTPAEVKDLEDENINAVIEKNGRMYFSNGLSQSEDEGWKWVDVVRSKYYIQDSIKSTLENFLMSTHIPFTQKGIGMVRNRIRDVCSILVEEGYVVSSYYNEYGDKVDGYRVRMPHITDVPSEDRDDRKLEDVEVVVRIPGHIQEITIDLVLLM